MKSGSGQRIGDRNPDVVRRDISYHANGRFNLLPLLAWIAKLQEQARANPISPQISHRIVDLANADSFIHRIEDALRSGLGAHPDLLASAIAAAP